MSLRPKILFVVTEDWFFLCHYLAIARYLQAKGYDVAVACRVSEDEQKIRDNGLKLYDIPFARESISPGAAIKERSAINCVINEYSPDIVIPIALRCIIVAWLCALTRPDLRILNFMVGRGSLFTNTQKHSLRLMIARIPLGFILRRALGRNNSFNVFLNKDDLRDFTTAGGAAPLRSFRIPGTGIDTKSWQPVDEPQAEVPIILFVGRLLRDKGLGELIDACASMRSKGIKHKLRIAGRLDTSNPNCFTKKDVNNWVKKLDVEWLGQRSDIIELMSQANIVAAPSYLEGFGRVLSEAGLASRAVVTCDTIGCRESVNHMENGLLVPPRDAHALADALTLLLTDVPLRHKLARKHYERVCADFSDDVVLPAFHILVKSILESPVTLQVVPVWMRNS